MNKEDFVTYNQAVKLKELGFDWECTHGYYMFNDKEPWLNTCGYANNTIGVDLFYCSAPTLAQAQKWLREVKLIFLFVDIIYKEIYAENASYYWRACDNMGWKLENSKDDDAYFDTYEQALSAGISRALEVLKKKHNEKRIQAIQTF